MFSLIRFSRNKLPAAIAIIAIMLLFIAPDVSKTLEHRRMGNHDEHVVMPASTDRHHINAMTDASDTDVTQQMPLMHASVSGMGGMMNDAAGYCVMLIHLPLMLWIFAAIVWLTLRVSCAPPPRIILPRFTVYFPGLAQPRAPPFD